MVFFCMRTQVSAVKHVKLDSPLLINNKDFVSKLWKVMIRLSKSKNFYLCRLWIEDNHM